MGQDYEKVAPKLPESQPEQQPVLETAPPQLPQNETIVIQELRAIVFLKDIRELQKNGLQLAPFQKTQKTFISADDFPLLKTEDFKEEMQPFLGHPMNMKRLNELTQTIADYYRRRGQPIVWIRLPEQNVTTGVVQLVIKEAFLGEVHIIGGKWIKKHDIREQLRLQPDQPILQNLLLSDLEWMNRNPFRQVTAAYRPSQQPGATDLQLQIHDRFPARFYTGYENTGNATTGKDRWYTGFNWGDAFGLTNNLFNYQYTTSSDLDAFQAHAASDLFPLPWRHLLNIFGSYNETEAELAAPMAMHGKSWNIGTRYIIPIKPINFQNDLWIEQNIQLGFDFKQSNNDLEFGGTLVTNTLTDINQFVGEYHFTLHDFCGTTNLGFNIIQSPGAWSDNNKNPNFQNARALSQADYLYTQIQITRQTELPWKFSIHNTLVAQWSDANLLAGEQLNLGGRDTIRGYEESEIRGDEGWYTRNELRLPPLSLGHTFANFRCKEFNDRLILLAFWDYGIVQNKHLLPGENRDTELSSIGPGLRYTISPYLTATADYGFQLLDSGTNSENNSKFNLSITLSY